MTVWEHDSVEENFDEMIEEMNNVKKWTLDKIKKLEDSTNIKKIQQFKPIYINKTQVDSREGSGWYDNGLYIRISVPEELYKNLEDRSLVDKFTKNDGWGDVYFKLKITEDNSERLNEFKQILDVICEVDKEAHEENLKIKTDNQKIEDTIFYMLDQVGINRTYYGYKSNRSTKKTKQYYSFPSEISKQIPTSYSETLLEDKKNNLIENIDRIWNREISKVVEERKKKEQEQKEKEQNRKLALLLAKYDLDLNSEWYDVMQVILDKNKYLTLAYYLEKNRGDWTSGCDYAETGLDSFTIENDIDQKIYDDINYYIEHWDEYIDGRCFRDCDYSYSVLYGMVEDEDLMKDFEVVKEQLEEW